jgi:hypothetical protein
MIRIRLNRILPGFPLVAAIYEPSDDSTRLEITLAD